MGQTERRVLLGGLLAGSLVVAPGEVAAAYSWSPRSLTARALRRADLIVGPDALVVRVASVRKDGDRFRIHYTHPRTASEVRLVSDDERGFSPTHPFLVLARDVPRSAVLLSAAVSPSAGVDGGAP